MSSQCAEGSCDTGAGASSCGSSGSCCTACNSSCGGDPTACATALWTGSFFQAMKEVQVELLKSKIQKAWGPKMEKAADAVLDAMGAQWQSMLAQAKAKSDIRQKLASLWENAK